MQYKSATPSSVALLLVGAGATKLIRELKLVTQLLNLLLKVLNLSKKTIRPKFPFRGQGLYLCTLPLPSPLTRSFTSPNVA